METKQVWKFKIGLGGAAIDMPKGAEILQVHEQYGEINIWALVYPNEEKEERFFEVYGTGHDIVQNPCQPDLNYIGTAHLSNGSLVFHVFERFK